MNASLPAALLSLVTLAAPTVLTVGSQAPDFEVTDIAGSSLTLGSLTKDGPVVLAFFPMANTSGCTEELTNLVRDSEAIGKLGAHVVAISGDGAEELKKFQTKLKASFSFVADDKGFLMKQFGVKMPILNKARRTTLVIGTDQKVKLILKEGEAIALTGLQQTLSDLSVAPK